MTRVPNFPERLNQARRTKRMTMLALADKIGASASAVNAFERGVKTPALDTVISIADALDVSVDWLVGRD